MERKKETSINVLFIRSARYKICHLKNVHIIICIKATSAQIETVSTTLCAMLGNSSAIRRSPPPPGGLVTRCTGRGHVVVPTTPHPSLSSHRTNQQHRKHAFLYNHFLKPTLWNTLTLLIAITRVQ